MIVQFVLNDNPVMAIDGVQEYETGKHHTTFVTLKGLVEMKTSSYDYFTVQLEASDTDGAMDEHAHVPKKKRIGFVDEEVEQEEGGDELEPAVSDDVLEPDDFYDDEEEDEDYWD